MAGVWNNLNPFKTLLENLLKSSDRLGSISASVSPVEDTISLDPEFSMIRINTEESYDHPKEKFMILEWKDEYGDFSNFIEISDRNHRFILKKDDVIDYYNSFIIFIKKMEIPAVILWYSKNGDEKSIQCELKDFDFQEDWGKYRTDPYVEKITKNGSILNIKGHIQKKLTVFNRFELARTNSDNSEENPLIIDNGKKYKILDDGTSLIVYDRTVGTILLNGIEQRFKSIDLKDYPDILKDRNIVFRLNKLYLKATHSDLYYYSDFETQFTCKSERFKGHKNSNGTLIQLDDDGSFESDVYSSTSFFFREDVTEVSDVPITKDNRKKGRRFQIGRKFEEENIIEITENKERPKDIPDKLYIVPNPYQILMQKTAVGILINEPSVHHKSLLRLMDDRSEWDSLNLSNVNIKEWFVLDDERFDGVNEQRQMVRLALSTNEFAFLEGPPGSGKTTTILEIISQLISLGKRVMLAASTHAAIDNILERIDRIPDGLRGRILPIRVGEDGRVGETVGKFLPEGITDEDVKKILYERANLVCGTTLGILKHPDFNLKGRERSEMIPALFDCLIVDEASKTTFQDFLVPALFAKKWILSGDIKQLTPYVEQEDIASSIRHMDQFDAKKQEAWSIIQNLTIDYDLKNLRHICIPLSRQVLMNVADMISPHNLSVFITKETVAGDRSILPEHVMNGTENCHMMFGAKFIFIDNGSYDSVRDLLPDDAVVLLKEEKDRIIPTYAYDYANSKRKNQVAATIGRNNVNYSEIRERLNHVLESKDWAGEVAWRLARQQELFMLNKVDAGKDKVKEFKKQIQERVPESYAEEINKFILRIKELSMPSILQLLRQGISDDITDKTHETPLNSGFKDYRKRSMLLKFQGRMHKDISAFSRDNIYDGNALKDSRTTDREWQYRRYLHRNIWLNVESNGESNSNQNEADAIVKEIQEFSSFTSKNPKKGDGTWTVAVLTYYRKQESNVKKAVAKFFGEKNDRKSIYEKLDENIRVEVYTIDKYQGKEADIVFISMVKSGRAPLGFMDSPNRLNVAITRARYQRVIVGEISYFKNVKNDLLKKLAEESHAIDF